MIVLDASAAVELGLGTTLGRAVAERIADPDVSLATASLMDVEATNVIRRAVLQGQVLVERGDAAISALLALDMTRYHHVLLLERTWALRHNLTAYDAAYVALAEALGATLVTCDGPLARVPGLPCDVDLVE